MPALEDRVHSAQKYVPRSKSNQTAHWYINQNFTALKTPAAPVFTTLLHAITMADDVVRGEDGGGKFPEASDLFIAHRERG